MTKAIEVGAPRQRPAKSCSACRKAKARCQGFTDTELAALDADLTATHGKRCNRCERLDQLCEFLPSRRKGRPRRLPKEGENIKDDADKSRTPESRSQTPEQLPSPEESVSTPSAREVSDQASPHHPIVPTEVPLPRDTTYDELALAYLTRVHPFAPLLPNTLEDCAEYLGHVGSHLHDALRALIDPSSISVHQLTPLAELGTTPDELQAGLFSCYVAYGIGGKMVAKERLHWVAVQLAKMGWEGDVGKDFGFGKLNEGIWRLGWTAWGMEVQLGVLTGTRDRLLGYVEAASSTNPSDNLTRQAFSLLFAATEPSPLDPTAAHARATTFISAAQSLYSQARDYYRTSRDEGVFIAAIMSNAATIFLLSSSSIFSTFSAPNWACGIDTSSQPPTSAHGLIIASAKQIIQMVTLSMDPAFPPPIHSPFFGCGLLIAVRGLLIGNEEGQPQESTEREVQLVEGVLSGQGQTWEEARALLNEVSILKRQLIIG